MESLAESTREQTVMPRFKDGSVNLREPIRRIVKDVDWLHLLGQFQENLTCFPEPNRDHVAQS